MGSQFKNTHYALPCGGGVRGKEGEMEKERERERERERKAEIDMKNEKYLSKQYQCCSL
jgi:hypothetical protein